MRLRFRVWWQTVRQHPARSGIIALVFVLLVGFALFVYLFGWDWTGFNGGFSQVTSTTTTNGTTTTMVQPQTKSLWDWLQLLIIPIMLAVGGFWLNNLQKRRDEKTTEQRAEIEKKAAEKRDQTERGIAQDNQQEAALQAYIDKMSELLLDKKLRGSAQDDEVRKIARVRTLTVLPRLDKARKKSVLQFIYESEMINNDNCIISLYGANLNGANLNDAIFHDVNLRGVDLRGADLSGAILLETDLRRAILQGAKVTQEQLAEAKSLEGATMPDGSTHP